MQFAPTDLGLFIFVVFVAYLGLKMILGVVKQSILIPLALGAGGLVLLADYHPGLAFLAAIGIYLMAGKVVEFSLKALVYLGFLVGAAYLLRPHLAVWMQQFQ